MRIKKQLNLKQYINKPIVGTAVAVAAVAATSITALAWGPERPTFTGENPADYVTFNSITNNPQVGDERNFVRIREVGTGNYVDEVKLQPGKEYEVVNYYHNNAKTSLNESGKGIAKDVTLKADVPSVVKPGERGKVSAAITSSNANPNRVWDEAYITADTDIALRYVPNSAVVKSNGAVNGQVLPASLFTTGALLGFDSLNGVLPGCVEFAGTVTYKLKADAPNFQVTKQVSKKGENKWQDKIVAKPGEVVDFRIGYDNTGSMQQDNVVVKDALPVGMSYVGGSTVLKSAKVPSGATQPDAVATNGLNIGSFTANSNAYVTLSAKVGEELQKCGVNELVNTATIITPNGNKQATATVTVDVPCKPNECKPGVPTGDERCSEACVPGEGQVVDENGNCLSTPGALPTTGPAETIMSIIGLGALAAGFTYWYRSRQGLKKAMAGINPEATDAADDAPKLLKAHTDTKIEDDKKDF